jgi:hypothetical protein
MKTKILLALGVFLSTLAGSHAQTNFTKITTGNIVTDKGSYIGHSVGCGRVIFYFSGTVFMAESG